MQTDVLVIGSGGAGFAAALAAARAGAKVTLLERAKVFGGTTAWSGAQMWIPNNSLMKAAGLQDSREDALKYIKPLTLDRVPDELIEAYVDQAPRMVDWMMSEGMRLAALPLFPDYHAEFPGGKHGRSIEPRLFDTNRLGKWKDFLRPSPYDLAAEYSEIQAWGGRTSMQGWDFELLAKRMQQGLTGWGRSGIGQMMDMCLKAGVTLVPGARAVKLMRRGKRVAGAYVEKDGQKERYDARLGVILACAGFEWNPTLVHRFLGVPMTAPGSPPYNTGDGLLMSMEVGANLANMTEHVGMVTMHIPGETSDGQPLNRIMLHGVIYMPGSIVVNRAGKRFVDEAQNYNDMIKPFGTFEPVKFDYPNVPAYAVFDQKFRSKYVIGTVTPADITPPWVNESSSLAELAKKIGVDPVGLQEQVAEFNKGAAQGKDPVFHRGAQIYDRHYGDKNIKPNPSLRPIDTPPYYGVEARFGSLGTKGGPITNAVGQVLDMHDQPIPGLYAAGNVAANVFGPSYPGAGATCGPAWTFGWLAGKHITS